MRQKLAAFIVKNMIIPLGKLAYLLDPDHTSLRVTRRNADDSVHSEELPGV